MDGGFCFGPIPPPGNEDVLLLFVQILSCASYAGRGEM